jgi:hypothetical protein
LIAALSTERVRELDEAKKHAEAPHDGIDSERNLANSLFLGGKSVLAAPKSVFL